MDKQIPVLAVRQPWASLIACNAKPLEVRTQNTNKRGPFALYASRTKPRKEELEYLHPILSNLGIEEFPRGKIISQGNLVMSSPFLSAIHFKNLQPRHLNPLSYYQFGLHFWQFEKMQAIEPIDFKFRGSVVWSSISQNQLLPVKSNVPFAQFKSTSLSIQPPAQEDCEHL